MHSLIRTFSFAATKPSRQNWSSTSGHLNRCDIDCTAVLQSQSVPDVYVYPHLIMLNLHCPTHMRSLFCDFQVFQSHLRLWTGWRFSLVGLGSFLWWWFSLCFTSHKALWLFEGLWQWLNCMKEALHWPLVGWGWFMHVKGMTEILEVSYRYPKLERVIAMFQEDTSLHRSYRGGTGQPGS